MHAVARDADGEGTNWDTVFRMLASDLTAYMEYWVLVEGIRRDANGEEVGAASIRLIPPTAVPRVIKDPLHGHPMTVVVKHQCDACTGLEEEHKLIDEYYVYDYDGVTVWREADEVVDGRKTGKRIAEQQGRKRFYGGDESSPFRYYADKERRRPILPLFRVRVPVRVLMGYVMAKQANAIYNLESARYFHLFISAFAKFLADCVNPESREFDAGKWDEVQQSFLLGKNLLPLSLDGSGYVAPPVEGAEIRNATIDQMVKAFAETFFQSFGDAAKQKTATQIHQESRSGVEAFLTLLVGALDEAENGALWRLEQVYFPDQPERWGQAHVRRSTNFQPVDLDLRIQSFIDRFLPGKVVPLDADTLFDVVLKILEASKVAVPEERKEALRAIIAEHVKGDRTAKLRNLSAAGLGGAEALRGAGFDEDEIAQMSRREQAGDEEEARLRKVAKAA